MCELIWFHVTIVKHIVYNNNNNNRIADLFHNGKHLQCESLQPTQAARGGAINNVVATHGLPNSRSQLGYVVPLGIELSALCL